MGELEHPQKQCLGVQGHHVAADVFLTGCPAFLADSEPSTSSGSGDAVAESGEDPAKEAAKEAEPQKKKGRRWTRAEKGSWANSRLVDDVGTTALHRFALSMSAYMNPLCH